MASEKVTAILEEIKALSVLDLSELVHAIEDEFGVSAAAPVAVAAAAAPGAAAPLLPGPSVLVSPAPLHHRWRASYLPNGLLEHRSGNPETSLRR